jgi:pimeloyl-ACP methyl ester carboxylesterase
VVVVHGALGSSMSWMAVAQRLADRFEFFLVDRRGRGESDDGAPPHSLAQEVDDAAAVLGVAGPRVALIGHSYGGAVALELTRRAANGRVDKLVLYEPGVGVAGLVPAAKVEELDDLVRQRQLSRVLELAIEELDAAGLVRGDAAATRPSPQRDALVEIAWTLPREIRAVDDLGNDLTRYASVAVPTLLMVGASSPHLALG